MDTTQAGLSDKEILDHAWKYFTVHASQRLLLFNVFVVSSGAVVAGLAACLQKSGFFPALGSGLGCLLVLNAFVFWKLDQRTSFLVKHAEEALTEIERTFQKPTAQLFYREPLRTAAGEKDNGLIRMWTYGRVFRFVFGLMACIGTVGASLSLLRYYGKL
jgi:hypothetical protein